MKIKVSSRCTPKLSKKEVLRLKKFNKWFKKHVHIERENFDVLYSVDMEIINGK